MSVTESTLPHRRFPTWLPFLIVGLVVLADQLLKAWALANLHEGVTVPFLPGLIDWYLTFNTGAAWSMFSGSAGILAIGRLIVAAAILVYLVLKPQNRFLTVVFSLIAGGAIGNTIDGLRFGKVTDMIHSPVLSAVTQALGFGNFPIFNVADSAVVLGTLLLLGATIAEEFQHKKKGKIEA